MSQPFPLATPYPPPTASSGGRDEPSSVEQLRNQWRDRIEQSRQARRQFEPVWLSNLAFAAGQHWLEWDPRARRLRHISELDPRYHDRELFTADRITEYRQAQLGELAADDDRPELVAAQQGDTAEQATRELNQAAAYAWEHEWGADSALRRARAYCIDLGVSAVRCRWNPNLGQTVGHTLTDRAGRPLDEQQTGQLEQTGQLTDGGLPVLKPVKEGRTVWEPLSALQLFPPAGVPHEQDFPWEAVGGPVPLDDIEAAYGKIPGLVEDTDIASAMGVAIGQQAQTGQVASARLRGHAWVFTCFQRPTLRFPDGRKITLVSNQYLLADVQDTLDYRLPSGEPHTGVVYLHWWRLTDRFWSQSFIAPLKDPQRVINRRETQNLEIIDRGMPKAYVSEGSLIGDPSGVPMEHIELKTGAAAPTMFAGVGPGGWMYQDIDHQADNLSHAATMSALRLGENPQNVDTYSQLALLNENEALKRSLSRAEHRAARGTLVELSISDMKRYWPDEKQILVAGDDDRIGAAMFRKATIPTFYMTKVAKGASLPRSQAAELKKLDAIWAAAVQSWVAVQDAQTWVEWYATSLQAGGPLDLPEAPKDSQQETAKLENLLMLQGVQPPVMDYDIITIHLQEHRQAMDEARAAGDTEALLRLNQHVKDHVAMAQSNAAQAAQAAAGIQPQTQPQQAGQLQTTPFVREPQPQMIPHAFASLAGGQ